MNNDQNESVPATRTRQIPESAYRDAFEQLLEKSPIEKITASQMQAIAGGRYSRAADFLAQFREEWKDAQRRKEQVPVQPVWFREFVTTCMEQHRDQLENQWAQIGPHIQNRVQESTDKLEKEKEELSLKYSEDRSQIEILENQLEALKQEVSDQKTIYNQLQQKMDQQTIAMEGKDKEIEKLNDRLKDSKQEVFDLKEDLKDSRRLHDEIEGQNKLIWDDLTVLREKSKADHELFVELRTERDNALKKVTNHTELHEAHHLLQLELQSMKTRAEVKNKQNNDLQKQNSEQAQENLALNRQIAILENDLERSQELVEQLKKKEPEKDEKPEEELSDVKRDQITLEIPDPEQKEA